MKKRVIISIIMGAVLIVALLLTGCNRVNGGGTLFMSGDADQNSIRFVIAGAQAIGEPYEYPILDDEAYPELQSIFFQDARGKFRFDVEDIYGDVLKIQGDFDGTFYVDPSLVPSLIPQDMPEGTKFSAFVGWCLAQGTTYERVELDGQYYLIASFTDYPPGAGQADLMEIEIYAEPMFENGMIGTVEQAIVRYSAEVVKGAFTIN